MDLSEKFTEAFLNAVEEFDFEFVFDPNRTHMFVHRDIMGITMEIMISYQTEWKETFAGDYESPAESEHTIINKTIEEVLLYIEDDTIDLKVEGSKKALNELIQAKL